MNTLRELFAHNDWGNGKLLDAAEKLDDAALDRPFEMGLGSLRATLHHLWAAERVWLDRWKGIDVAIHREALEDQRPAVAVMRERMQTTAAERAAFLDEQGATGVSRRIEYANMRGERFSRVLADLALHVCNHGVYHRAQATNMLRHVAGAPIKPGLDYLYMRIERAADPLPTLNVERIRRYFAYADWARDTVHTAARALTDEQLDRPFEMGLGTLRMTLLHVRFAEQWWLDNHLHGPAGSFPELPADAPVATIERLYDETAAVRNRVLAELTDEELRRTVQIRPRPDVLREFPVGEVLLQLCSHGTHHRAQAANMLRHLGVAPPALDLVAWLLHVEAR